MERQEHFDPLLVCLIENTQDDISMRKSVRWVLIPAAFIVLYLAGRYVYLRPTHVEGEVAPEIVGNLPDGEPFELADLRGNYVLLDFWGSWCGPCIQNIPAFQDLYSEYQSGPYETAKGFEIVSIAIERDASRWSRALDRFQPAWPYHLLDQTGSLRFFNGSISRAYGVKQLPTKILLNPDGELIGTNWSIPEIESFLQQNRAR
jgi:thiol-disulfide isomerase/thioredoxin